jgi:hypothetical protein
VKKERKELRIKWTAPFLLHASLPFTYIKKRWIVGRRTAIDGLR